MIAVPACLRAMADTLGADLVDRLRYGIRQTYETIASDAFGETTPDDDDFVDMILHCVDAYGDLSDADLRVLVALDPADRDRLILTCGP